MLYGCVTRSPAVAHLAILRAAHHRLLLSCAAPDGSENFGTATICSYADALAKTGCENVETTARKRSIIFAGFVARMGNEETLQTNDVSGRGEMVT